MVNPSTDPQDRPTVHPGTVPDERVGTVVVVVVVAAAVVVVTDAGCVVGAVMGVGSTSSLSIPSHELHEARTIVNASQRAEDRRI
ncbi:MAG: hypothetical protein ACXW15_05795 [Acidimicrobiia bacterium]